MLKIWHVLDLIPSLGKMFWYEVRNWSATVNMKAYRKMGNVDKLYTKKLENFTDEQHDLDYFGIECESAKKSEFEN